MKLEKKLFFACFHIVLNFPFVKENSECITVGKINLSEMMKKSEFNNSELEI